MQSSRGHPHPRLRGASNCGILRFSTVDCIKQMCSVLLEVGVDPSQHSAVHMTQQCAHREGSPRQRLAVGSRKVCCSWRTSRTWSPFGHVCPSAGCFLRASRIFSFSVLGRSTPRTQIVGLRIAAIALMASGAGSSTPFSLPRACCIRQNRPLTAHAVHGLPSALRNSAPSGRFLLNLWISRAGIIVEVDDAVTFLALGLLRGKGYPAGWLGPA